MIRQSIVTVVCVGLFCACSTPNDETSEIACENAGCPPGTTIDLNASSINQCEVGGSVKVLSREGEVDAKCYAEGSCSYICVPPVCCGGEKWTLDSYECEISCCPDGTAPPCKTACGNGECDGDESPETCPQDCADTCGDGDCTGEESPETCPTDCGCIPACVDKECGDDGCGGSCGGCPDPTVDICHAKCDAGQCVAMFIEDEICDGKDNDCDGVLDDGFADTDDDGKADCVDMDDDDDMSPDDEDCAPLDPAVHPAAEEFCNDKDDNCDGNIDEEDALGCDEYYLDEDEDDFGVEADYKCLCKPEEPYDAQLAGDCNDDEYNVNPDATEICDGLDNDCNEETDPEGVEGCTTYYVDEDEDGFGKESQSKCLCDPEYPHTALEFGDCEDANKDINPGVEEACNEIDDNCDQVIDAEDSVGCAIFYYDGDVDTIGTESNAKCLCAAEAPYDAAVFGDCNDQDNEIFPGNDEVCDGKDNDCDNITDPAETSVDCQEYYEDGDQDMFGKKDSSSQCLCDPQGLFTSLNALDCDDLNKDVNPDQPESCSGLDDNCDGKQDNADAVGCIPYYVDADQDDFGPNGGASACLCEGVADPDFADFVVTVMGDCDDLNKDINPDAPESCNNIDDDCDEVIDPEDSIGCGTLYFDGDNDNYAVPDAVGKCLCQPDVAGKFTAKMVGDCNDDEAAISPDAVEVCDDVDNDCSGAADDKTNLPGCEDFYYDNDGDGYFELGANFKCLCEAGAGELDKYTATQSGDCNDNADYAYPGHPEICDDGADNDCNNKAEDGVNKEGCVDMYPDDDMDGVGANDAPVCLCATGNEANGMSESTGDCNDGNLYVGNCDFHQCGDNGCGESCGGCGDGNGCCVNSPAGWIQQICAPDADGDEICDESDVCPNSTPGAPVCVESGCQPGDVDKNGCFGLSDLDRLLYCIHCSSPPPACASWACDMGLCLADVTQDGILDELDLETLVPMAGNWLGTPECDCEPGQWQCPGFGACHEPGQICDGNKDCGNKFIDETGCDCVVNQDCAPNMSCNGLQCCYDNEPVPGECDPDPDGDYLYGWDDDCPNVWNTGRSTGEGIMDECNPDKDGDGVNKEDGDCNDYDFNVKPGAQEICGNWRDDDCNPATPDSCN